VKFHSIESSNDVEVGAQKGRGLGVAFFVLAILVLLPIDWFSVTGEPLREVGAKPAILLMILTSLWIFFKRFLFNSTFRFPSVVFGEFILILFLGLFAFFISVSTDKVDFGYFKKPLIQFVSQASLLAAFFFVIFVMSFYFRDANHRSLVVRLLPWAALLHLTVFILEAIGLLHDNAGWLLLFRVDGGAIERSTGLMSEPSYFGIMAALFGMPLILMGIYKTILYRILGWGLLFCAYSISAKSMFMVMAFQLAIYILFRWKQLSFFKIAIIFLGFIIAGAYMATERKVFNLEENMSSANRFGSTLLAINLASNGYCISGVGTGQFHFFFKEKFAPSFLLLSKEARMQFKRSAHSRASTYNLFVRLLVESGLLGLLFFLDIIRRALKKSRFSVDATSQLGIMLVSGSIGFLMTQDTYFYPPLALGLALTLSSSKTIGLKLES